MMAFGWKKRSICGESTKIMTQSCHPTETETWQDLPRKYFAGTGVAYSRRAGLSWTALHQPWEKAMAPHSSTLAWKIPWTEEPGRLQSMGSLRVGHDWETSLSLFTFMHWRGKWQPTPVFLPGESQGRRGLVGCRLWGHTESDTTEATLQQ